MATRTAVRFDGYEADPGTMRLLKNGRRVKLQEQPVRILLALASRAGEVVTREELRREVWTDGVYVEFDDSLNTSISKLRRALDDNPASPRYIETLPRRGYRFVGRLEDNGNGKNLARAARAIRAAVRAASGPLNRAMRVLLC